MINNVTLTGRTTKDVELRYSGNGKAIANFTLAVDRNYKDGEGNTPTDFIDVVVFGRPAENVANYVTKGSLIGVTGSIQTRNYDNNEGKKVYVTEVVAEHVTFLNIKQSA